MKNFTGAQGAVIVRLLIESYRAKAHRILEAGFTGQKKDKLGHTRYYQNGRQVKNPNAKEKSAIHAAASQSLPAGQAPSHNDAATRVDALHADTPPEHVAALANDLMKMSVEDLTKMAKGPAEEEPKQKRANAGGEVGPNGEHYKGGAFIATTEMPKSMKDKIKRAAGDGMETVRDLEGNVTREKPPHPGMMSISGTMMGTLIGRKGEVNEQYLDYLQASPEKRKQVADLAEKYRAGEHWAPINDYPNVALGKHIYQLAAAGLPIAGSLLGRLKGNADFQKYYKKQTEKAAPAAAPAPTPDKTPTAAANKPAFTGTDAQGRQWQDGELVAAKDKPPAPTAGMSADANALDALRLKSNKKTHNPAHINPEALSSLKAQGFIDDKNKLTPAGRTHLYAEKLKGAPAPTGSAAATPAAPKPKWKRANRNKDSLISIVKRKGGINSNSVKKDYDYQADIIEGGLLHAIRKQGMGLDEMAASLQVEGHIIVPEGVDPGDYLLDRMKGRHHSALRNTDKEIESEAEAFYKAQHEAKQGGHDERSIEGSRRSGAQTGKSAGQKEGATELDEWDNSGAGETGGGEKDATVSGDGYDSADTDDYDRNAGQDAPVDNSFDFGANADEPKADEPAPAPATAAPTAALKKDPRDKTYEKLIKKGKPIHNATDDDNGIHEIDRKHITPELRRLLQSEQSLQRGWDGPPEETESFQLKDKSDVTGDPLDDGMILIDKRKKNLALKQRHLDTLHAAGKNTDSEANDKKAKANADVENAIMHHLKNNYDATGTELRRAGGHKEYDENDPTSNPVHAALDRLEKSGKIKKGSGGNPLYSKADEAPAPTTDEAPATPAPDQPGFTGVDSQGREWQNGELVAAKDDEPAPAGKAEPEPEPKAAGKEQPETIGKGSTGDVTKQGDQVYKTANENESNAYSKLAGIDGVAPGKLEGDKIVTPFYKHVISVDTIPYEKRQTLGPILKPNLGRMVNAVTALSDEGLSYNDPLQFGFDKDKKSNLLDFSMAEKVDNAPRENLSALANYLKQFGLSKHGDAMTQVALVSDYITPGSRWLDDDSTDSIDGAKIEANLDGKPGKYAYYSFNARTIPGVAQTGHRDAANVIFSDKPLSNEFMETWEIHPAIHRTDAKTDEPEPKAAPEPEKKSNKFENPGDVITPSSQSRIGENPLEVVSNKDGWAVVGYKNRPGGQMARMPSESLDLFRQDQQGRVDLPDHTGSEAIDNISNGKGKLLGSGDDGLAYDAGDKVVKVSTTAHFHAFGHPHRSPAEAVHRLKGQAEINNDMIKAGVPGLLPQTFEEHGNRGFITMEKLDTTTKLTPEQVDEVARNIEAMHKLGYALGDQIQVGIDFAGHPKIFDTGKAVKAGSGGYSEEDHFNYDDSNLERFFKDHGLTYEDPEQKKLTKLRDSTRAQIEKIKAAPKDIDQGKAQFLLHSFSLHLNLLAQQPGGKLYALAMAHDPEVKKLELIARHTIDTKSFDDKTVKKLKPMDAPAPAAAAPDQPGFTGTDAQGREWQDGKLVAAKDDEPAAPAGKAEPEPEPKAEPEPEPAAAPAAAAPTTDDIKRTAAIQKEKSNNIHKGMEWNLADDGMVTVHHAVTGREIGKIDLDTKKLYPSRSDEDSKQKLSGIYDHLEKLTQTQSDREKIQSLLDRPHKGNNKNEILELNNKIAERGHKPEPVPDYLTPAAPDADPVTEPSTPAAAAAEPQPNDTPRTVAARVSAAMADEFEGARNSTLPNMGQDTPGSARHKAMAWKGLKDAEANGTAEALVKRDELLKNDPSNLSSILAPENFLGVLTSHLTMQAFPKEVLTYAEYVKNEKHHVSTPAQLREQYYEAFTEIKKLTEDLSTKKLDPRVIASEVNKKINGLIEKFRKEGQGEPSARPGRRHDGDSYNPVANSLISMQKRVLGGGANSVVGRVNDFGKRLFTATGEMSYNSKEKAVSAVADILEGKSFNQAFDTVNQKKKEFDFNEAYGGEVTRTGGKKIDMSEQSTSSPGAKVFMDDMKVRGVQFGNSLPDQERVYHAQKSAEALSDLTSILGLPDEAAGLGGKLGLAIGARGKGGALAHFEPYQANDRHNPDVGGPVINLTRANGAGSLAHEWGHGLDHYAANNKAGGGKFLSHPEASRGGAGGSPETIEAMKKVQEAMGNSGFDNRLIDETVRRRFSGSRRQYWTSPEEKFARTFERHVQNKLHEAGRENTYLTGLHKQGHPLWPTNDEMAHMAPHMDALIAAIAAEKFPNHTMPTPAPAAPKTAATKAPATEKAPAAPAEEKPTTAMAAWWQRGGNKNESPFASFAAIHGRPPTSEESQGQLDALDYIKGKFYPKAGQGGAPAPKEPAAKSTYAHPLEKAWEQRGSRKDETPYEAFQALHGRKPTMEEMHGGPGGLFEKLKGSKAFSMPNQGSTITDVTPAGYGPGEADTPPAAPAPGKFLRMRDLKDAHRLPPDDLVKKHGWSWTGTDEKGNQWHNGRFIGEEGTYKEAVMPTDPHAEKIKLIQAIIARRGIKPPQPKAQAKKIPEASEDPRVKRIRELMDAYC